jgi:catechol 2,3-dioxygenase-like lactoylglutathione lyase family enzyme
MLFKQRVRETRHINPRFRAYGKARLDIANRAKSRQDWDQLWKVSTHPFPFKWGSSWKHCVEYNVDDFPAEVGFYIDILGMPVNAFDPSYAMFTSPDGDFFIGVVPTSTGVVSTPRDAIRLQFMVSNILEVTRELERRGVIFDQQPEPIQAGSSLYIGYFRTPHGIPIGLWGDLNEFIKPNDFELDQDNDLDDVPDSISEHLNTRVSQNEDPTPGEINKFNTAEHEPEETIPGACSDFPQEVEEVEVDFRIDGQVDYEYLDDHDPMQDW